MNLFLLNIANIHIGYTYPGGVRDSASGTTRIIQMGDAWPELIKKTTDFARVHIAKVAAHHYLRTGDLIFRPRSPHTFTLLIEKDLPGTICATPLMVIRLRSQKEVLAAYLNWYLNLPGTQMEIAALATGKKGRGISIRAMEGLELPIPTLAVQQFIVDEDSKVRFALQQAPSEDDALAKSNTILLGHVGDERHQEANEHNGCATALIQPN